MLDIKPTDEDERVLAVNDSLRNTRREQQQIEDRLEDLEIQIPSAEEELDDVKAEAELGNATESEVEDVRQTVDDLKAERDNLTDRLDTLERVESRLQTKRREAVENAAADRQEALNNAAKSAMSALLDALNDAEDALDALNEIREFAATTKNRVDRPPQALQGSKAAGVGIYGHSRSLEFSLDALEQRFGSQ